MRRSKVAGIIVGLTVAAIVACGQKAATPQISREDSLELQLIASQIESIKTQANAAAAPLFQKQQDIATRVCKANKLEAPCDIDPIGGTVRARVKPDSGKK